MPPPPRKTALSRAVSGYLKYLVPALFLVATPAAQAVDYTWQGGTGNWTASNWSIAGFPNASTSNVFIDGGNPLNSVVNLNTNASIGAFDISSGDALIVLNGQTLTLGGGISTNTGDLTLNGVNQYTGLRLTGDTTLAGNGSTVLSGVGLSYISSDGSAGRTLTVGAGHTVKGLGYLGYSPNVGGSYLNFTNQGTVRAEGGSLNVFTSGFDNSGGQIQVADGATFSMQSGTVSGGTVQGAGGSSLGGGSGTYQNLTLQGSFNLTGGNFTGITNEAHLMIANGSSVNASGTLTASGGDLTLNGVNHYSGLRLTGDTTLAGNGSTVLSGVGLSYISSDGYAGRTLTVGAGHTVKGLGYLGYSPNVGGSYLNFTNQGTVRAEGGSLNVFTSGFDNSGGQIQVADGGTFSMQSGTVSGGTVQGAGGSSLGGSSSGTYKNLSVQGGFNIAGGTFDGVTLNDSNSMTGGTLSNVSYTGPLTITNGGNVNASGTLAGGGDLTLNGVNHYTGLRLTGDTTLAGNGSTVLSGVGLSYISSDGYAGRTLTVGAGHTVKGLGYLGYSPNVGGSYLNFTNQGTVQAEHGTMQLYTTSLDSTAGTLAVASDGVLQQHGGTVTAQTINVAAGGSYTLSSGLLETNTFNGDFTQSAGTFAAGIGSGASNLSGNYTLNSGGTLEIDLAGHDTGLYDQLFVGGNLSLAGALSLVPQAGFSVAQGDVFDIATVQGSRSGTFSGQAEGSSIAIGASNLYLTYLAGNGNDIALVAALTAGSKNFVEAASTDVAYVAGTRDAPTGGGSSTTSLKGLDVLAGSSYTLGSDETLDLDNGNGTLNVTQGAVFTGNGIIRGNIHNAGLVRIPITALGQVTGGHVEIPLPQPVVVNDPPPALVSTAPVAVNAATVVSFGGSSSGGGGIGGGGGSGGGGGTGGSSFTPVYTLDAPVVQVHGSFAVDASLEVTGSYAQTDTGALRLFVGGNQGADFGTSRSGGSYSQLFVGEAVSLDGSLQLVLQPELFGQFAYAPHVGDTFDFVIGSGGISLLPGLSFDTFVTAAGANQLSGLTYTLFDSGISSDPDSLFKISDHLFDFALAENGTVLRGTLVSQLNLNTAPVPVPAAAWLMGSGLLAWLGFGSRRRVSSDNQPGPQP